MSFLQSLFKPNVEKLKAKGDVKGLVKALEYYKDSKVRPEAADALVKLGTPAVEPLVAALKESDKDAGRCAAEALGKIGDVRAVEPLIAALKDSEMIEAAADALGKIDGARAVEPLIAALKDSDDHVRWAAAKALAEIGDASAVLPLIVALYTNNDWLEKAVAEALRKFGAPAVEPLISEIKNMNSNVRYSAAEVLDQLGWKPDKGENGAYYWITKRKWDKCIEIGAPAVEPLIAALNESYNHNRKEAARALVSFYRSGRLDNASVSLILNQRMKITKEHFDSHSDNGCGVGFHTDEGIGEDFPL